ncbi:MAG: SAM-dependent chlorinase/fluorinase [Bacteroidia bacterium]|nr:SAM-dependent chlorinase/fluorinase [Bacteroidia bacterium]
MGPIVLMTDFGEMDGYVGAMKGVITSIAPQAQVIDLSHHIPPQDLDTARFVLWNQHRYFPSGSIFVCVVDPGVGSERDIVAVKTDSYYFLAPDNGLLDYVLSETRPQTMLRVENPLFFRAENPSQTFHGRDIFAPAAAHLVAGEIYTQLGPMHSYQIPASPFVDARPEQAGKILHIDHFGNLITNIRQSDYLPAAFAFYHTRIEIGSSYASVKEGEVLALAASHGLWEISQRNGRADAFFQAKAGDLVHLL